MRTHDAALSFYSHWCEYASEEETLASMRSNYCELAVMFMFRPIIFIFLWKRDVDPLKTNCIWLFLLGRRREKRNIWFHSYARSSVSYHVFASYSLILVSIDPFSFVYFFHVFMRNDCAFYSFDHVSSPIVFLRCRFRLFLFLFLACHCSIWPVCFSRSFAWSFVLQQLLGRAVKTTSNSINFSSSFFFSVNQRNT